MKLRHNKKRNTAFLYETLVKELTKSVVNNNLKRKDTVLSILKEHFSKNSILGKELQLYKDVIGSKGLDFHTAEKILYESKMVYWTGFKNEKVYDEQSEVISKVNKDLSKSVFSNFIPNYKSVATISQIFNFSSGPKEKVLLERKIVLGLTKVQVEVQKEALKPLDELVYSTFVKKFNEKYGALLEEQKKLLYTYVMSVNDNGLQLRSFLNEELYRLREGVESHLAATAPSENDVLTSKMKGVVNRMNSYRGTPITESLIQEVMKIQELVKELESNGD